MTWGSRLKLVSRHITLLSKSVIIQDSLEQLTIGAVLRLNLNLHVTSGEEGPSNAAEWKKEPGTR